MGGLIAESIITIMPWQRIIRPERDRKTDENTYVSVWAWNKVIFFSCEQYLNNLDLNYFIWIGKINKFSLPISRRIYDLNAYTEGKLVTIE